MAAGHTLGGLLGLLVPLGAGALAPELACAELACAELASIELAAPGLGPTDPAGAGSGASPSQPQTAAKSRIRPTARNTPHCSAVGVAGPRLDPFLPAGART
jgi:hypothetical protein